MGLFGAIKSNWKKSEAAVVLQNLLEHIATNGNGFIDLEGEPAQFANQLVADVWDHTPDIFEGKFGQRPHKITVAASALAYGIVKRKAKGMNPALLIALGNVISEVGRNGSLYPLTSMDRKLLVGAVAVYLDANPDPVSDEEREAAYELVRG